MAKSLERLQARTLRRAGESIREIAKTLQISRSSASLWCRDIVLTEEQVQKLMQRDVVGSVKGRMKAWEWHREEKRRRFTHYHDIGYEEVKGLNRYELFLTGLALYWAEGSKSRGRVLLTNSDPHLILIYLCWLQECFGVNMNEITCRVTINELHAERMGEIEQYWSMITGVPLSQFTKTTTIHSKWAKLYENKKTYYGVLALHVQKSTNLIYRIMGSIDRLREIGDLHGRIAQLAG